MQLKVLGAERRRRWSYDEKVRLVEETLQAGETVCDVARRHGELAMVRTAVATMLPVSALLNEVLRSVAELS
jgi:Transposase